MSSLNEVNLIGHVGRDPEIRTFPNGGTVANLTLATTEKWKDKNTGERKEATEWHRISFGDGLAGVVEQYVRKGSLIYVKGSLHTRKWTDKSGAEKYSTEVRARSMLMLGTPPSDEAPPQRRQSAPSREPVKNRPQPDARPAKGGASGFDDMDDDISW